MDDVTETARRERIVEINAEPGSRKALEAAHGQVWTTDELRQEFEFIGFMAPVCVVRHRSDGRKGSVFFQHHPRFFFSFVPDGR
jgi:hypothetical protein